MLTQSSVSPVSADVSVGAGTEQEGTNVRMYVCFGHVLFGFFFFFPRAKQ